ncbi:MAG: DUF2357 domain-containing protein, partial [Clostridia bacterium]|nr:DUF2357 domain-containing protein [Clostridia bacterium]
MSDKNITDKNLNNGFDVSEGVNVYSATAQSLDFLRNGFDFYSKVLTEFSEGKGEAELRKRFILKKIDEAWVTVIEDSLPSLDTIIRNPNMFLQEQEEVMPTELTRRVTSRSIVHLSQHTDLINEIKKDGTVVPSKLLNVYQDETILTYENKFINTLVNRLYGFVARRYNDAAENGQDEKITTLKFNQEFENGEQHAKISLSIEVEEPPKGDEIDKNYIYTTDLWARVKHIYQVVTSYQESNFCREMGKNFIRPPVIRTNMILKNVNFKQCLALWEFLEGYENAGYSTIIHEDLENISDECIHDFYNAIISQYVLFEKHINGEFEEGEMLAERFIDDYKPEIVEVLDEFNPRDYAITDLVPDKAPEPIVETGDEDMIELALRVALAADDFYTAEEQDENEVTVMDEGQVKYTYRFSFLARLIMAQDPTQDYYGEIKNELLSYEKVKSRISWSFENFTAGRDKCARINVKGKTIYLYLPLDPKKYADSKYFTKDVSNSKATEEVPLLLKVRSARGVKYAKELIADVMANLGLNKLENPEVVDYHMPYEDPESLCAHTPPLAKRIDGSVQPVEETAEESTETEQVEIPDFVEVSENEYKYRFSFTARLIFAQNPTQDYYNAIKNELLSYDKVKSRISWGFENFTAGRDKCARINVKGKTLYLYLPLDPSAYETSKYFPKDVSNNKATEDVPFLLKVRSARGVKYAKELIAIVMKKIGIKKLEKPEICDYHLPYETPEVLARRDPPLVKLIGGEAQPSEEAEMFMPGHEPVQEEVVVTEDVESEETGI